MDIFTQKKWLVRSLIFLAVLNISSISFVVFGKFSERNDRRPRRGNDIARISDVLKKELNLSEVQMNQLYKIRNDFFEKEQILGQEIREKRDSMNLNMFNLNTSDTVIITLARNISEGEYKMEVLRYQQAKSFKEICSPEQQIKFQNLVVEIRDYFRPEKH